MKIICKMMALCIIVLSSYPSMSQVLTSNRQNYFSKYSQKLPASVSELDKAFQIEEGAKVKINFDDFSFNGVVTSSIKRYDDLYSVLVKAPGLDNTILSLSKIINPDKSISYIGRIINQKYADGFELRKDTDGTYAMNKIRTDALIEDY
jgi:hypothetical protein